MRAMIRSPMAVRVVFLEVDTERAWAVASIGPGFIGAYLRTHGHEVGFVRATVDQTDEDVVNRVAAEEPDIVGISLVSPCRFRLRRKAGARGSVPR